MPIRSIQSKDNARLKELRRALAKPPRSGEGLVGIEGPNLIAEALRSGLSMATIFVAQGSESLLDAWKLPAETEILHLPAKLLSAALATETPQPVAALVSPPRWDWDSLFNLRRRDEPLILVLAGLQDPGNLGTILRSAEAFGATGVVALAGTVSPWNPKALRASAGSAFRVPLVTATAEECFARLRAANIAVWTTTAAQQDESSVSGHDLSRAVNAAKSTRALAPEPYQRPQPADRADLSHSVALIVGNEGNGVPDEIAQQAGASITIPCPGPVESLNAAVAASVLLYESARQRELSSATRRPTGARR
jgi:TrmH family RNA methyltransferase